MDLWKPPAASYDIRKDPRTAFSANHLILLYLPNGPLIALSESASDAQVPGRGAAAIQIPVDESYYPPMVMPRPEIHESRSIR